MTKEFVYIPYIYRHNTDLFPRRLKELCVMFARKGYDLPYVVRMLVFMGRNMTEAPEEIIRCMDYVICTYFFPLESNKICWEIYLDEIWTMIKEERALFNKLGFVKKEDLFKEISAGSAPDLNQMYSRLSYYEAYGCKLKNYDELSNMIVKGMAEDMIREIQWFMDDDIQFACKSGMPEKDKINYLTELSGWISMESSDGEYEDVLLNLYPDLTEFLSDYKPSNESERIFRCVKSIILRDYSDVVNSLIIKNDARIQDLETELKSCYSLNDTYMKLIESCDKSRG